MGIGQTAAKTVGASVAPKYTFKYVRAVLDRAIDGVGPVKPAAASADAKLVAAHGDVEAAVKSLIRQHTRLAGIEGFTTNLGGIAAAPVAVPANITGVALIQCHLAAGIVHLRGYDLEDPRVRNAILACMLGRGTVEGLIKRRALPSSPMALATAPVADPLLDELISREVTTELIGKVAGRRAVTMVGRRIPLFGSGVGAASDALTTHQVGTYTAEEMLDRRLRVV
ncbi:MAG: hypothetical protein JWP10_953 [Nocardioidaceae bacterium]|nr:hypothetical protein [Nocardioidaceae bacterium]